MSWLVAPHNDYRTDDPGDPAGSATVVIPVYNRVELLERTLAALAGQTVPTPVIVADDGSEDDVAAVVDRFGTRLAITHLRQPHQGYGAGRARNLGAAHVITDVVVFIDADCIPSPDLVERHLARHTHENLVVIGARRQLRAAGLDLERLATGSADLGDVDPAGQGDFRETLYRRTSGLTTGSEAYRSLVSSNFSIGRRLFDQVGGFATDFHRWGGEDTELGWRLQNAGAFFVPADDAVVYHQTDLEGPEGWRQQDRHQSDGLITSKIPHRFYRRVGGRFINQTPKWSVVVWPAPRSDPPVTDILDQTLPDVEVVIAADPLEHEPFAGSVSGDPRVRFVPPLGDDPLRAPLLATRGELVLVVHGAAAIDRRLLARAAKRMDERPRVVSLTLGYKVREGAAGVDHLGVADTAFVDLAWGWPLPLAAVARRRDWARGLAAGWSAFDTWQTLRDWDLSEHLRQPLVWLPGPVPIERPVGFQAGAENLRELLKRPGNLTPTRLLNHWKDHRRTQVSTTQLRADPAQDAHHVRYVGWTGKDNLGDEAMLEAVRRLMPWAKVETGGDPQGILLLGGGTLINRTTYLRWLLERDSPRVERAVFGTGVASPEFWGTTEDPAAWVDFLSSCAYVGVRGPSSVEVLRGWGYRGQLEQVGDPALALLPTHPEPTVAGRVVVAPVWTRGELWGGEDDEIYARLAEAVAGWVSEGRDVHLLACHPDDDRPAFSIMRRAGHPDLPYCPGYLDLERTLTLLSSAEVVVAERLHAAVLAAACQTPFVALEYRPKLRDFAASVGAERWVIRTDQLGTDRLTAAARDVVASGQAAVTAVEVETCRRRLKAAVAVIRQAVER